MPLTIAPLTDANLLLALNNAAVPDVGELSLDKARWLTNHCVLPGMATLDDQVAGIVVVLSDHCGYNSDFYRRFTDRYTNFLYVDRVIVTAWARGRGVATALYQATEQAARAQGMAIASDVYSEPPNTPSLRVHRSRGFVEIEKQHFPAQQKTVTKFMQYVDHSRPIFPRAGS
jgi:uncharacterized protein